MFDRLRWWTWITAAIGLTLLIAGTLLRPGYLQDVVSGLGVAALLLVPLVAAERAILQAIDAHNTEDLARDRLESAVRLESLFLALAEQLEQPGSVPMATGEQLLAMLTLDGWARHSENDSVVVVTKSKQVLAVPVDDETPPYTVLSHVRHEAGWTDEQFARLLFEVAGQPPPPGAED